MKVLVKLVPEERGGFSIFAPEFPGCMSQGETEEEAIQNIKEVIPVFVELRNKRQENPPHKLVPYTREIEIEA
ncbi:type II toxin-antitoxin system HicB family antitoxin [Methanoregula sp.]|uniref:type II toxin-antitoxin system HicB family antitoxin n=1 Tax=Methanoregula sp. TaxID=2052170 RepID=UPI0035635624